MGDRTYSEFRNEIRFNLGNPDISDLSDTKIGEWFNQSYLNFCTKDKFYGVRMPKEFFFPELDDDTIKTTSDGSPYVAKPAGCLNIYTCFDNTNKKKLTYKYFKEYIEKTDRATASARTNPVFWSPFKDKIYLYPTPDAIYQIAIYFRKKVSKLSSDSHVTLIGEEWDEPMTQYATTWSLKRMKQYDEAERWKIEFLTTVQDMLGIYLIEERDTGSTMQPDPNYLRRQFK